MQEFETAILILNYNGKKHLEKFLPSVIENNDKAHIYLIDNASTDDSIQFIENEYPDSIQTIKLKRNFGFAEGYNVGVRKIKSNYKYFVFLNSDVELSKNWLNPLVNFLNQEASVAGCQPKVKSYQNKNSFEHAGATGGYLDRFYFPFCRGRIFSHLEKDKGQYDYKKKVHWISGACMIIRSDVFFKVQGFDSDFFAHMEEIDLCLRISAQGYDFYCIPDSVVYHLGGGTLNYQSPRKTYLNFRNNLSLIIKNHDGLLIPKLFLRMSLDGIAACLFLLKLEWRNFLQIGKAHAYMYLNFFNNYKKRKELKKLRNYPHEVYRGSIVFDYYIKGVKKFSELNNRRFEL